ncbi:hypothetical protein [Burkholderia gladioli]|uniref:hypothetical protein n=1 Tax=Burkholderia gladioli TaxID=28095 RepID=UPI00163E0305|nr:hypothetical protein [Burkholderia gladioli]
MRTALNADQVEVEAIRLGVAPVIVGVEDEQIAGELDDEILAPDTDNWAEREAAVELAAGETLVELQRRVDLLGDAYPFVINAGALRYRGSVTGVYEFCLAASVAPRINQRPNNALPLYFELLATEVARLYIGVSARAIRTGWPSHDEEQRPTRFKAMSAIVNQHSGEWVWAPVFPNPDDPDHIKVKDEGVDFVVWQPMLDNRPGKLFLLGQCACGNDWDQKLNDIKKADLNQWLNPITSAAYLTSFFVPRHLYGAYVFGYCNERAGITFDRARIAMLAESESHRAAFEAASQGWELREKTQLVIPEYRVLRPAAVEAD